jgi:phosphatidylglycerophosphatase A
MIEKTDAPPPSAAGGASPRQPAAADKPRFALFVATACGLGYIPFAPGTFGSLAGVVLALLPQWLIYGTLAVTRGTGLVYKTLTNPFLEGSLDPLLLSQCLLVAVIAVAGIWTASRSARFWGEHDPQRVVVDEVSGQHLALIVGALLPTHDHVYAYLPPKTWIALVSMDGPPLSWKYLLLGLILFRAFDIWKPFPVRQAESLPGGWGIMADDWVAAIYAGLGLWIARAAGI